MIPLSFSLALQGGRKKLSPTSVISTRDNSIGMSAFAIKCQFAGVLRMHKMSPPAEWLAIAYSVIDIRTLRWRGYDLISLAPFLLFFSHRGRRETGGVSVLVAFAILQ